MTDTAPTRATRRPARARRRGDARWVQRAAFVVILAGAGALVAGIIASRTTERFDATAVVTIPSGDSEAFADLADEAAAAAAGDDEIGVDIDRGEVRFVGRASTAAVAAQMANDAAEVFVLSAAAAEVQLADAAVAPTSPTRPRRLLAVLIGIGAGGLLGLVLQSALRPAEEDPGTSYVPPWTRPELVDLDDARHPEQSETPAAADPDRLHLADEWDDGWEPEDGEDDWEPGDWQDEWGPDDQSVDEAEIELPPDEPTAQPEPTRTTATPASRAGGFQALVATSAEARRPRSRAETAGSPHASDQTLPADESADQNLVDQITFLSAELQRYQTLLEDERAAARLAREADQEAHRQELDEFAGDLEKHRSEVERLLSVRDSARSQLEDRIGQLELELTKREAEIARLRSAHDTATERRRLHDEDLALENEFLRAEIERYQDTLDRERVSHATALAEARLENQDEIDQLHRDHRVTLNQLAHTNRNLLTAQRNEAESALAALEADHQRQLDEAHADYERRLREARRDFDERIAAHAARADEQVAKVRSDEVAALNGRLASAVNTIERLQQRLDAAAAEHLESERALAAAKRSLEHVERQRAEDQRRFTARIADLESQLERSEARLADERRRTGDVVRNLLEESASTAAQAERARREEVDGRQALEARHQREVQELISQARAFERAAGEREALLEATIAALRAGDE